MSKDCDDCDRLQDNPEEPGGIRRRFNQPTMYDHMPKFSKFKGEREKEKKIKVMAEELLTFNPKFTDLRVDPRNAEKIMKNFSTQDVAKFKNQMKSGALQLVEESTKPEDLWQMRREMKPIDCLTNISGSPINCPVKRCNQTVGITSVLLHFLRDHEQDFAVDCVETFAGHQSFLTFNESVFRRNENLCLGTLAYGGVENMPETRPGLSGVCKPNSFLPDKEQHFTNHLPILIMGCKTTLAAIIRDKALANQFAATKDRSKDIIVLWLATVETTKNINYTLTVYDQQMATSRSTITAARNLKYSQDPNEFLPTESNFMVLNRGEINLLSENGTAPIQIEIVIHEYEE